VKAPVNLTPLFSKHALPWGTPSYHSHGGRFFGDIEMARGAGAAGCIGICWNKPAAHLQAADVAIAQLDEIQILEVRPAPCGGL